MPSKDPRAVLKLIHNHKQKEGKKRMVLFWWCEGFPGSFTRAADIHAQGAEEAAQRMLGHRGRGQALAPGTERIRALVDLAVR